MGCLQGKASAFPTALSHPEPNDQVGGAAQVWSLCTLLQVPRVEGAWQEVLSMFSHWS